MNFNSVLKFDSNIATYRLLVALSATAEQRVKC